MHHAVGLVPLLARVILLSLTFRSARRQMVDKVWYDSQNRNSENPNSFFGGTVRALQSLDTYKQYPNGGPPFLNVRFYSSRSRPGI